ncbi:MAG: exo-alpha-sialidase [Saprospiraceae bacterium]|nr:exo-alpha-sialidase [Saprospiraceae bacterium]
MACKSMVKDELTITELHIPVARHIQTETPNWHLSPQDNLYLTWTSHLSDSLYGLNYSSLHNDTFTRATIISTGTDWFVNWADFPSIAVFPGSELNLLAHFLQKRPGDKTYDYDVKLALSRSGGDEWKVIDSLHDNAPAEHGFVSLVPFSYDKILAMWLDGRAMISAEGDHNDHDHGSGSMQLRSALVDIQGGISQPQIIDDRVCECCQTDATMTPKGPVLIYRNRSNDEERDIYITRLESGQWSDPKPVCEDHWKINGCPVNGPAIASINSQLAVAWYTEAEGKPTIKLSFSNGPDLNFGPPLIIDTKNTPGRVSIAWIDKDRVAISLLDKDSKESPTASIYLMIYSKEGHLISRNMIAQTSALRKSGFPVLTAHQGQLYLAYTSISQDNKTSIKAKKILMSQ